MYSPIQNNNIQEWRRLFCPSQLQERTLVKVALGLPACVMFTAKELQHFMCDIVQRSSEYFCRLHVTALVRCGRSVLRIGLGFEDGICQHWLIADAEKTWVSIQLGWQLSRRRKCLELASLPGVQGSTCRSGSWQLVLCWPIKERWRDKTYETIMPLLKTSKYKVKEVFLFLFDCSSFCR